MTEILDLLGFAIGDRHAKERLRFLGRFHFIGLLSFGGGRSRAITKPVLPGARRHGAPNCLCPCQS